MDESTRHQFNMKVLRRHDSAIVDILESASFVVLYSHDGEWTKTGIEGPMFLYRRSANPPYGFFVLNRNGVENFSANLTVDDDLELTTEFIIYRASKGEDVIGIWIFEPGQRESVGQQMIKLQATPLNTSTPYPESAVNASVPQEAASSSQASQSISLDALFGKASQESASAEPKTSPNGLSLLESIFDSASPNRIPKKAAPPSSPLNSSLSTGAEDLKALLGLQSSQPKSSSRPQQSDTAPSGIEALFASISVSTPKPAPETRTEESRNLSNGKADHIDQSAADLVDASLQSRKQSGASFVDSLSRRDFVREVLSLIHTDKDFVDDLFQRYQAQGRH